MCCTTYFPFRSTTQSWRSNGGGHPSTHCLIKLLGLFSLGRPVNRTSFGIGAAASVGGGGEEDEDEDGGVLLLSLLLLLAVCSASQYSTSAHVLSFMLLWIATTMSMSCSMEPSLLFLRTMAFQN